MRLRSIARLVNSGWSSRHSHDPSGCLRYRACHPGGGPDLAVLLNFSADKTSFDLQGRAAHYLLGSEPCRRLGRQPLAPVAVRAHLGHVDAAIVHWLALTQCVR
jgi:hypothetical protein